MINLVRIFLFAVSFQLSLANAEDNLSWEKELDFVTFQAAEVIAGSKLCDRPLTVSKLMTETLTYYSLHPAIEADSRNLILANRSLSKVIGMEERFQGVGGVSRAHCANVRDNSDRFLKDLNKMRADIVNRSKK